MINRFFAWPAVAAFLASCTDQPSSDVNKFSDPVIVKIYDLKDRRLSDSLYRYFEQENALYRKEAAMAFASIQDSLAVDKLGRLLFMDSDTDVRLAAAFALGQTPGMHSERLILAALTKESNYHIVEELLEAYGKATSHWQLVQPDLLNDTAKAEGFAWSLYRAGLNKKTDNGVHKSAVLLLDSGHSESTRLGAAHFFARGAVGYDEAGNALRRVAQSDPSAEVRMAASLALRKIKAENTIDALIAILRDEKDPRVKVNAIRAMQPFMKKETADALIRTLQSKNTHLSVASAELLKATASEHGWVELSNMANFAEYWRAKAGVYEAAVMAEDHPTLFKEIQGFYQAATDPYQKAAWLTALQASTRAIDFLEQELFKADVPVVKVSAASALVSINHLKNFDPKMTSRFASIYQKAIGTGDPAVIATVSGALADSALNYKSVIKDIAFLKDAKTKLSLPKDNEALQPLEAAIAYFEGTKPAPVANAYNNPIDWALVKSIPADQVAIIKTSKGNVTLRLLVEESPGSVANFVKLARENYFDNKFFHRVVPNFVIQAGCNRGDGFGSEDYSIRSEFSPRRYKTGSVGMASAGKDTEGTQWFITHSPTPHLDGRYTIFAEVIKGMEAVNQIEVGDRIVDVEFPGYDGKK